MLSQLRCDGILVRCKLYLKAITGSYSHAPWWEGKCSTVSVLMLTRLNVIKIPWLKISSGRQSVSYTNRSWKTKSGGLISSAQSYVIQQNNYSLHMHMHSQHKGSFNHVQAHSRQFHLEVEQGKGATHPH